MQAAATALFSTGDVVSITPENDADQVQAASAALKQELINYRLSRETKRNGIKWFLIASGAVQTMQITGVCVSKQSWIMAGTANTSLTLKDLEGVTVVVPSMCYSNEVRILHGSTRLAFTATRQRFDRHPEAS